MSIFFLRDPMEYLEKALNPRSRRLKEHNRFINTQGSLHSIGSLE